MVSEPITILSQQDFRGEKLLRPGLWIVEFGTSTCAACRATEPQLIALMASRPNVQVGKIDVETHAELADAFDVTAMPALFLFNDGDLLAKRVGAASRVTLEGWVDALKTAA